MFAVDDYESAMELVEHILERDPERERVAEMKQELEEKIKDGLIEKTDSEANVGELYAVSLIFMYCLQPQFPSYFHSVQ